MTLGTWKLLGEVSLRFLNFFSSCSHAAEDVVSAADVEICKRESEEGEKKMEKICQTLISSK